MAARQTQEEAMNLPTFARRQTMWDAAADAMLEQERLKRVLTAQRLEPVLPAIEAIIERGIQAADEHCDRRRRRTPQDLEEHYALTRAFRFIRDELRYAVQAGHEAAQTRHRRDRYAESQES
jgi:hypothetical protein